MRRPCGSRSTSHSRLVSAIAAADTSHMATLQPSATSWRASSRPMPVPPPVMTAILPARSFMHAPPSSPEGDGKTWYPRSTVLLETLLPLGKVDPGLRAPETPLDLSAIGRDARLLEEVGYTGLVVEETKDDPFVLLALAAQATTRLKLGTSVAIAFPRSPAVKAHIERRYGLAWSPAGPWMRDYVGAVRAFWDCWQNGTPLRIAGPHYKIDLMVPLFNPGPIEQPAIPIQIAAVNE